MPSEQGVATSQQDFVDKLTTFASSVGTWTLNNFSGANSRASISNGGIFVHFGWDGSQDIGVHQSTAYINASTLPGAHTNDSGNGGTLSSQRSINAIGNGPYTSHFFYTDTTPSNYLYAALEFAPGQYRHFAAGDIVKTGDWTGGAFAAAGFWETTQQTTQASTQHSVLMDAGCNNQTRSNTMRIEGLPNQAASGKWGIFAPTVSPGVDGDTNGRANLLGGMRGGPYTNALGTIPSSLTQGFIPLALVPCFYIDTSFTPDKAFYLGYFPNIRVVNMSAFQPQDTLAVGGDTWRVFPMTRRQEGGAGEQSGFGGIAYKVT